ncbi:MAG: hypothetical protein M1836_001366 [Candelina mexicana]|nr:MAG: hypothetical protein M1836_001366 [Candelina mexicana]
MSPQALQMALLRPAVLHILRAAGFHSMRPSVLDAVVDICARYMLLLADKTAAHALNNHNDLRPEIIDLRMAMQDCSALVPQKSAMEEEWERMEDMRGVEAFIEWARGPENKEIRRTAGLAKEAGTATDVNAPGPKEDYLTVLKKKHSKTGEESRYQGTVLGKSAENRRLKIEGGAVESIQAWGAQLRAVPSSTSSSSTLTDPLTPASQSEHETPNI